MKRFEKIEIKKSKVKKQKWDLNIKDYFKIDTVQQRLGPIICPLQFSLQTITNSFIKQISTVYGHLKKENSMAFSKIISYLILYLSYLIIYPIPNSYP